MIAKATAKEAGQNILCVKFCNHMLQWQLKVILTIIVLLLLIQS